MVTAQPIRAAISKGTSLGNRRDAVLGDDGILAEGGDPAGVDGAAVPEVLGRFGVDAGPFPPVQHDVVARLDAGHAGAGLHHDAAPFVTEQVRQEPVRALGPGDLVELLRRKCRCDATANEHLPASSGCDSISSSANGALRFPGWPP